VPPWLSLWSFARNQIKQPSEVGLQQPEQKRQPIEIGSISFQNKLKAFTLLGRVKKSRRQNKDKALFLPVPTSNLRATDR
jgi:hypothetical protein